jgi:hypothetical protein
LTLVNKLPGDRNRAWGVPSHRGGLTALPADTARVGPDRDRDATVAQQREIAVEPGCRRVVDPYQHALGDLLPSADPVAQMRARCAGSTSLRRRDAWPRR